MIEDYGYWLEGKSVKWFINVREFQLSALVRTKVVAIEHLTLPSLKTIKVNHNEIHDTFIIHFIYHL